MYSEASIPSSRKRSHATPMCSSVKSRALRPLQSRTISTRRPASAESSCRAAKCTVASNSRLYGVSKPSTKRSSASIRSRASLSCSSSHSDAFRPESSFSRIGRSSWTRAGPGEAGVDDEHAAQPDFTDRACSAVRRVVGRECPLELKGDPLPHHPDRVDRVDQCVHVGVRSYSGTRPMSWRIADT